MTQALLLTIEDAASGDIEHIVATTPRGANQILLDIVEGKIRIEKLQNEEAQGWLRHKIHGKAAADNDGEPTWDSATWNYQELASRVNHHIDDLYIYWEMVEVYS